MIRVTYSKTFERQLAKVPNFIQEKVKSWLWSISVVGLTETQKRPGLHDYPSKAPGKAKDPLGLTNHTD